LASNPAAFKDEAVKLREAWRMYDTILRDRWVVFAEEPEGVEIYWRAFTQRRSFSPKLWGDAYLAAFARAASLDLVTFLHHPLVGTGVGTFFDGNEINRRLSGSLR
jgi:hypothetical protein